MDLLLFNSHNEISEISKEIASLFQNFNLNDNDSRNVFTGSYYFICIIGIKIKIEYNSYDYEDKFKYMISIKKDYSSKLKISPKSLELFSKILIDLLRNNLNIDIAYEVDGNLIFYKNS